MAKSNFMNNARPQLEAEVQRQIGNTELEQFTILAPREQRAVLRYIHDLEDHIDDLEARILVLEGR